MKNNSVIPFDFYNSLSIALMPYIRYWNDWATSSNCFLSKEELEIIQIWLNLRSKKRMEEELKIDEENLKNLLHSIVIKLQLNLYKFKEWLKENELVSEN